RSSSRLADIRLGQRPILSRGHEPEDRSVNSPGRANFAGPDRYILVQFLHAGGGSSSCFPQDGRRGKKMRLISVAAFAMFMPFGVVAVFGQSERASISGTVTDSSGAVVPGAKVVVTNPATNATLTTMTTESGDYTAPNLSAGSYTVRVEHAGF